MRRASNIIIVVCGIIGGWVGYWMGQPTLSVRYWIGQPAVSTLISLGGARTWTGLPDCGTASAGLCQ